MTAMKKTYDKSENHKDFPLGSMVLIRELHITERMEDSWKGPYEVTHKASSLNYKITIPGRGNRS